MCAVLTSGLRFQVKQKPESKLSLSIALYVIPDRRCNGISHFVSLSLRHPIMVDCIHSNHEPKESLS